MFQYSESRSLADVDFHADRRTRELHKMRVT